MKKSLLTAAIALLVWCGSVYGQITISTNNYHPAPGTTVDYYYDGAFDSTYFASLKAGSGGPMVWDFSSRTYGLGISWLSIALPDVPAIDSFPTANLAMLFVQSGDSIWYLYNSVPTSYSTLGNVSHYFGLEYVWTYQNVTPWYTFPFTYGDTWTSHHTSLQRTSFTYTYTYDTTYYTVDAWGTAKYGSNTVPCLRVVSNEDIIVKTFDNTNALQDSSFQTVNQVDLIGAGFQYLVSGVHSVSSSLESYVGTASPVFLNTPTDVQEISNGNMPSTFELSQNYPNPFNPTTEIDFSLPTKSKVDLAVYDVLGRKVNDLVNESLPAGTYAVEWNGKDQAGDQVASGVYFYKLTAGDYSSSKKMVLLK